MPFRNREEAAERLATALAAYRGRNPLVLAIPRGAVPMGRLIADELAGELNVVLVRKLGAPGNPEFAIGAVDEHGSVQLSAGARQLAVSSDYIAHEAQQQLDVLQKRSRRYRQVCPFVDPRDRLVIVVDDGIATGATMMAALRLLRSRQPGRLVVATAVAPPEALEAIRPLADEVVCLETPAGFFAIGQFFAEFPQVSDDEVIAWLRGAGEEERLAG